jgi:hypothetical protein
VDITAQSVASIVGIHTLSYGSSGYLTVQLFSRTTIVQFKLMDGFPKSGFEPQEKTQTQLRFFLKLFTDMISLIVG